MKAKRNLLILTLSIIVVIIGSLFIYYYLNIMKESLRKYSVSYFSTNAIMLSNNIVNYISKNFSKNLYAYLKQNKNKQEELNDYLSSFKTEYNKNIFLVYKDKKGFYRVLADGEKNKNQRFEFNEKFIPLKKNIWNNMYKKKKYIIYSSNIKDIWMTLLYPYVENNKIKFFLVYDFSISPVKWLSRNLELIQNMIKYFLFIVIFIIIILVYFIFYDAKIQKKLENYNKKLEKEVKKKIVELREKDNKMLLQSRMALMGELLNMIAHQWRQPLNSISSIIGNMKINMSIGNFSNEQFNKKLSEIDKIIHYLSETIETFSRFYRKDIKKSEVELKKLIEETIKIITPSIQKNNIKIIKTINSKCKIKIYQNYLKQVLLNLLKNAIDVLLEKNIVNPEIIIKIFKNKDKCIIEIEDNAGGVDEKIKDKIFEPYFTTKDEKNGTGLGLYMSKVIVENYLKGKIFQYNSEKGAVFRIELKVNNE